ncbi:copper resistance protein CopC [Nocardioides sp. cx-173]|uniref:copper resistance CopC/CopD family protein n=1 Tax=Nocardioides sp. cx-173 TaxID=2898796 RepID=UPI001E4FA355|nr:copper resistance protein CopC [Nocardioides sp. cx-173]MCD4524463.1 copper resistance protein CopC [Nocardioides sp. cx-173]UGB43051.1 copper resistance protein CopC [Nocardioides sp. cx-173]
MARRGATGLLVVLLVALALLAGAAPASAHATLVGSDPAEGEVLASAPAVVTFTFDEPVSLTADGVQVFDAEGESVDSESSARDEVVTTDLPAELADGTYVVTWRVVSSDGHPITGSLSFSVGSPSETVVPPRVDESEAGGKSDLGIAQALQYVGLLLAGGLVVFLCWLAGPGLPDRAQRAVAILLRAAVALALVSSLLCVPLAGAYQQGLPFKETLSRQALDLDLVLDDVVVLLLQAVGLGIALLLASRPGRRERVAATAGAALAVWSPALVGHTRAFEPVPLLVVTDLVHLTAGAIWLGGLAGLAIALPAVAARPRRVAELVAAFSTLGAAVLVLLVATGTLLAWRILGSWSGLVDTRYGQLLLVKIGIAALVVLLAAYNRFRLLPQVRSSGGHQHRLALAREVRTTTLAEAGLLATLLLVTGFLVNQSPREEAEAAAPAPSRVVTGLLGERKVLATLDPGTRGQNTLTIQLQDATGEPLEGYAAPEVSVSSDRVDLGLVPVVPTASGTYAADLVLPAPGTWQIQVSLREDEFVNPVTTLRMEVS